MRRQVRPVRRSATRMSSSASQQSRTWARMRGSSAVEDRPQLQGALQVPEAAFGFEQVLVAQRDVLGGQVRVGGGEQVLAVEALLGGDLGPVDTSRPVGSCRSHRPRVGWSRRAHSARGRGLVRSAALAGCLRLRRGAWRRASWSPAVARMVLIRSSSTVIRSRAASRCAFCGRASAGLWQTIHRSPVTRVVEADFLDAQVVPDLPVAALRDRACRPRGTGPHPFPGDAVPTGAAQVVQVRGRRRSRGPRR